MSLEESGNCVFFFFSLHNLKKVHRVLRDADLSYYIQSGNVVRCICNFHLGCFKDRLTTGLSTLIFKRGYFQRLPNIKYVSAKET